MILRENQSRGRGEGRGISVKTGKAPSALQGCIITLASCGALPVVVVVILLVLIPHSKCKVLGNDASKISAREFDSLRGRERIAPLPEILLQRVLAEQERKVARSAEDSVWEWDEKGKEKEYQKQGEIVDKGEGNKGDSWAEEEYKGGEEELRLQTGSVIESKESDSALLSSLSGENAPLKYPGGGSSDDGNYSEAVEEMTMNGIFDIGESEGEEDDDYDYHYNTSENNKEREINPESKELLMLNEYTNEKKASNLSTAPQQREQERGIMIVPDAPMHNGLIDSSSELSMDSSSAGKGASIISGNGEVTNICSFCTCQVGFHDLKGKVCRTESFSQIFDCDFGAKLHANSSLDTEEAAASMDFLAKLRFPDPGQWDCLNLNNASLFNIPEGFFAPLTQLRGVTLDNNMMTTYNRNWFKKNTHLRVISVNNNRISSMFSPQMFEGMVSLEKIFLAANEIVSLPSKLFKDLPLLYHIDLSDNNLSSVPDNMILNCGKSRHLSLGIPKMNTKKQSEGNRLALQYSGRFYRTQLTFGKASWVSKESYDFFYFDYLIGILDLSRNKLNQVALSAAIYNSQKSFALINLNDNRIEEIPTYDVGFLSDSPIFLLSLQRNRITKIDKPNFMKNMCSIKSPKREKKLPAFKLQKSLFHRKANFSQLYYPERDVLDKKAASAIGNRLCSIDLSYNFIKSLPVAVLFGEHYDGLVLKGNPIFKWPDLREASTRKSDVVYSSLKLVDLSFSYFIRHLPFHFYERFPEAALIKTNLEIPCCLFGTENMRDFITRKGVYSEVFRKAKKLNHFLYEEGHNWNSFPLRDIYDLYFLLEEKSSSKTMNEKFAEVFEYLPNESQLRPFHCSVKNNLLNASPGNPQDSYMKETVSIDLAFSKIQSGNVSCLCPNEALFDSDKICSSNSNCNKVEGGMACACKEGFYGNGMFCAEKCSEHSICGDNAFCEQNSAYLSQETAKVPKSLTEEDVFLLLLLYKDESLSHLKSHDRLQYFQELDDIEGSLLKDEQASRLLKVPEDIVVKKLTFSSQSLEPSDLEQAVFGAIEEFGICKCMPGYQTANSTVGCVPIANYSAEVPKVSDLNSIEGSVPHTVYSIPNNDSLLNGIFVNGTKKQPNSKRLYFFDALSAQPIFGGHNEFSFAILILASFITFCMLACCCFCGLRSTSSKNASKFGRNKGNVIYKFDNNNKSSLWSRLKLKLSKQKPTEPIFSSSYFAESTLPIDSSEDIINCEEQKFFTKEGTLGTPLYKSKFNDVYDQMAGEGIYPPDFGNRGKNIMPKMLNPIENSLMEDFYSEEEGRSSEFPDYIDNPYIQKHLMGIQRLTGSAPKIKKEEESVGLVGTRDAQDNKDEQVPRTAFRKPASRVTSELQEVAELPVTNPLTVNVVETTFHELPRKKKLQRKVPSVEEPKEDMAASKITETAPSKDTVKRRRRRERLNNKMQSPVPEIKVDDSHILTSSSPQQEDDTSPITCVERIVISPLPPGASSSASLSTSNNYSIDENDEMVEKTENSSLKSIAKNSNCDSDQEHSKSSEMTPLSVAASEDSDNIICQDQSGPVEQETSLLLTGSP
eukprot:Nk52_evm104s352 gene=Nk52_evmTU104s352